MTVLEVVDPYDAGWHSSARRACGRSTRPGCSRRRTSTSRCRLERLRRHSTTTRSARRRLRGPRRRGWATSAWTSRRSATASTETELPSDLGAAVARRREWLAGHGASAHWSARIVRCGWEGARCTWIGTGRPSAGWPPTCSPGRRRVDGVDPAFWPRARGAVRRGRGARSPAPRRRPPCCGACRCRRGPGTGKTTTVARVLALLDAQASAAGRRPPLVALAAPTGKAAPDWRRRSSRGAGLPISTRSNGIASGGSEARRCTDCWASTPEPHPVPSPPAQPPRP